MARMVSSIYGWAAGAAPKPVHQDVRQTKLHARSDGKPTPFLDSLLERQDKILSGKNMDASMHPCKRTIESCHTFAWNKAKQEAADPFVYGRNRTHAKHGLV